MGVSGVTWAYPTWSVRGKCDVGVPSGGWMCQMWGDKGGRARCEENVSDVGWTWSRHARCGCVRCGVDVSGVR